MDVAPTLPAALFHRDRGWRPFPLDHPALPECVGLHKPEKPCDGKRGKHPVVAFGSACNVEPQDGLLETWFARGPRNIGIACGPSGLLVVDEDEFEALTRFALELGHTLPITYRVRTLRGWHWYFDATDHPNLGNKEGLLRDRGMDVRGNGGFVVAAGSMHASGHVYFAEDDHVIPAPLPEWLAVAIQTRTAISGEQVNGHRPDFGHQPRRGTEVELRAQYRKRVDAIEHKGNAFRTTELFTAARDGWRLIDLGLLTPGEMGEDLKGAVRRVWDADPDERDKEIVNVEARKAALEDPWEISNIRALPTPEANGDEFVDSTAAPTAEEIYARELATEVKRQRLQRDARRVLAEEARGNRPRIRDGLVDSSKLDSIPPPRMLMGELIPHAAMGFLGGDTGTYKSFVAVSWACCLAAGRPWQARSEFAVSEPVKVLYVAAEGAAGAAQRIQAWMAHHDVALPAGALTLYPRAINLTSELEVDELAEIVAEHGYGLVIIDTLHQSAPGSEDNSATDFGLVFSAMSNIRADCETTVLFIDHSGHDGTRIRGTAAKGQDSDFVLMAERAGENVPGSQRKLRVHKRKDLATEGSWEIRLRHVELPDGRSSAIVELGPTTGAIDIHDRGPSWWSPEVAPALPEVIDTLPRVAWGEVARDLYRAMAWVGHFGGDGATRPEMLKYCQERPGRVLVLNEQGKCTTFDKATTELRKLGVLVQGATPQRWTLPRELPPTSSGS
jgi:hypothetical protein